MRLRATGQRSEYRAQWRVRSVVTVDLPQPQVQAAFEWAAEAA